MSSETPNLQGEDRPRSKRSSGTPWFAFVLIVLGLIFLLQQFIDIRFDNWWALFILIPALGAFGSAVEIWRRSGRFTFAVWSTFYGGLFPLLVALIFLFNLDWADYWPLFVILAGFGMLVSGLPFKRPDDENIPGVVLSHRPWMIFVGLSATLLGFTFLGFNLDWFQSFPVLNFENWWGIFILIPSLGGLITAILLILGRHSIILAMINLGIAALIAFIGFVTLYEMNWNLINLAFAVILILVGIGIIFSVSLRNRDDQSA